MTTGLFLPGVPEDHIRARMSQAGGNEIDGGKFAHPESSAALAANTFGWYIERSALLPPLPDVGSIGPARRIEIEYCARFPWRAGRHPWLDAVVFTKTHLIGVESKRFASAYWKRPTGILTDLLLRFAPSPLSLAHQADGGQKFAGF